MCIFVVWGSKFELCRVIYLEEPLLKNEKPIITVHYTNLVWPICLAPKVPMNLVRPKFIAPKVPTNRVRTILLAPKVLSNRERRIFLAPKVSAVG